MRANNLLRPLTLQLSCSTSPLGMGGMWAASGGGWQPAGSESDNRTYLCHMPGLKPICTSRPMAFLVKPPPSPPPLSPHQPHLPWVGTDVWSTDAPTLEPLLEPWGSTETGTELEELLAKVSLHTVTSFAGHWGGGGVMEVLWLNAGHFITQDDLTGCSFTAQGT